MAGFATVLELNVMAVVPTGIGNTTLQFRTFGDPLPSFSPLDLIVLFRYMGASEPMPKLPFLLGVIVVISHFLQSDL